MKKCSKCKREKGVGLFYKDKSQKSGLNHRCIECEKGHKLEMNYGLTQEQYNEMLESQGGACAICPRTPEENGKALAVDHLHSCCPGEKTCGKCVRGLLCSDCNTGIGFLQDKTELLMNAAAYLIKHS